MAMLPPFLRVTSLLVLLSVGAVTALACDSVVVVRSASPEGADSAEPAEVPAVVPKPEATVDAGPRTPDAEAGPAPGPAVACVEGGSCADGGSCSKNEGARVRLCACTGGAWQCSEILPEAPTGCAAGKACAGTTTCAVDDGTKATYCRCGDGSYACQTSSSASATCQFDLSTCMLSRPSPEAAEWLGCFTRSPSTTSGLICEARPGGFGGRGETFRAVCPSSVTYEGALCPFAFASPTCGCVSTKGDACVCQCLADGAQAHRWLCL